MNTNPSLGKNAFGRFNFIPFHGGKMVLYHFCQRLHTSLCTYFITYARIVSAISFTPYVSINKISYKGN